MRSILFTGSAAAYMRPPLLTEEMLVAGPDWQDSTGDINGVMSFKTPLGAYSVKEIFSKIPQDKTPDLLVCLVDATMRSVPRDLAFFRGPKVLLVADTHHLKSPISSMIRYSESEPFDRIVFLYDRHHAGFFHEAGLRNLFWFPGLTFPHSDKFVVESRKVRSRSASIGFVGQAAAHHPRRRRMLEALGGAGLPLIQKHLSQSESLAFYASSLMGLNTSLNSDFNLRIFEILASGCLLLTDELAPDSGLDHLASIGCAFETYKNESDLIDKARYFLSHPREAYELAKRGREWFDSHFLEELRTTMFQRIAFDGIAPECFPLQNDKVFFNFGSRKAFLAGTSVYEKMQELHRVQEEVRIGTADVQEEGVSRIFATLPRMRVQKIGSGGEWDLIVGEASQAAELLALKPWALWFPKMEGRDISDISRLFSQAGYINPHPETAFFQIDKPNSENVAPLCLEAMRLYQAGDFAKAFEIARQAFERNNQSVEAAKLMADVLLKLGGQANHAERLLRHALALKDNDEAIRPALAEACLVGGRLDEAMLWVRESIARDPENLRTMRVLAKIHEASGDLDAALETLELATSTHPASLEARSDYAIILRKAGRAFEGLQILTQVAGRHDVPIIDPSKKPVRVAFLAQHPQGWTNFKSVWEAMRSDSRFSVTVVSAPYWHPYPPEGGPEAIYAFLDKQGITHRKWDSGILRPDFADVLFVQNPYDVTRPAALRTGSLMKLVPRLAYIPYGLEIGGGQENATNQYNLHLQQRAWMVFARSERQKAMYARHCGSGNSHVAVTGHPKIDPIKNLQNNFDRELAAFAGTRKVFLWNPQFDIRPDGTGFSTFLIWNEFFLKEFQRRQDSCLIIRPHPLFFGTLEARKIWDNHKIEYFLRECQNSPNILIDRSPSYLPVFAASSALISDASSFLLEYAATGKPILYLPNPKGPQLNEDGEFVNKHLSRGDSESSISAFLENVIAGIDEEKSHRIEALKEFLEVPPSGTGVEIKERILKQLVEDLILDHNFKKTRGRDFWNNCSNTHLADRNYYIKASQALEIGIKRFLKKSDRVVDFGCGAGESILMAAPHVASVIGFDISESLVLKAKETAQGLGLHNARFERLDLESGLPKVKAEAIFCLGVFSCIQEDAVWHRLVDSFSSILKPGGILILRETLASHNEQRVSYTSGYYAVYRCVATYISTIKARSFHLLEDVELFKRSDGL